jgi:biotin carboxyl carrier protein
VDGEPYAVTVQPVGKASAAPREREHAPAAAPGVVGDGPSRVTAPMPGTILDIEVQVGDPVQLGQILCALEAMKMKSPIRATRAGTVRQVQATAGQAVGHGDLLFVVE